MSKVKRIEVMGDEELWSLLNGYGPNSRSRPRRYMTDEERSAYLLTHLEEHMPEIQSTSNIRLVIEVKEFGS